jgi:hypothetical protein
MFGTIIFSSGEFSQLGELFFRELFFKELEKQESFH